MYRVEYNNYNDKGAKILAYKNNYIVPAELIGRRRHEKRDWIEAKDGSAI